MHSGPPAVVGLADLMQLVDLIPEVSYDPEAIASEQGYCQYNQLKA